MPLVSQPRAGVTYSRERTLTTDASVARNFSQQRYLYRIMATKVAYRVVLFMRPSDDAAAPELEEHGNSNHDTMDKVELILIQLHGMDSSEVVTVKEVLMRATQRFQDLEEVYPNLSSLCPQPPVSGLWFWIDLLI